MVRFNFGVRDPKATRKTHKASIAKVKEKLTVESLLGEGDVLELEHSIYDYLLLHGGSYLSRSIQEERSQKNAKELSSFINQRTREWIQSNLEFYGHPKSWHTGFYMAYYGKINTIMRGMARNIWGWL